VISEYVDCWGEQETLRILGAAILAWKTDVYPKLTKAAARGARSQTPNPGALKDPWILGLIQEAAKQLEIRQRAEEQAAKEKAELELTRPEREALEKRRKDEQEAAQKKLDEHLQAEYKVLVDYWQGHSTQKQLTLGEITQLKNRQKISKTRAILLVMEEAIRRKPEATLHPVLTDFDFLLNDPDTKLFLRVK